MDVQLHLKARLAFEGETVCFRCAVKAALDSSKDESFLELEVWDWAEDEYDSSRKSTCTVCGRYV